MNMNLRHNIELGPQEVDNWIDGEIRAMAKEMTPALGDVLGEERYGLSDKTTDYLNFHAVAVFLAEHVGDLAVIHEQDPREWWKSVKQAGDEALEDFQLRNESVKEASQPFIDEASQ